MGIYGPALAKPSRTRAWYIPNRTVVAADGWKLNLYGRGQGELYDLGSDPCELVNLYHRSEQVGRIDALKDRIRVWQEETGDDTELDP